MLADRYGVGQATIELWLAHCGIFPIARRIDRRKLARALARAPSLTALAADLGMDRPAVRVELLRHRLPRPDEQPRTRRATAAAMTTTRSLRL